MLDSDCDGYLSQKDFINGLFGVYCSSYEQQIQMAFYIFDFDGDNHISKDDITIVLNCIPLIKRLEVPGEGRFAKEGGGAQTFEERVN